MFFLFNTVDIASYADDNTPLNYQKKTWNWKKKKLERWQNYLNGFVKTARKQTKISVISSPVLTSQQNFFLTDCSI